MKTIFLLIILLIPSLIFSQEKVVKQNSSDAFTELEENKLTLRFFNALNGNPIEGAKVEIEKSGNYDTDFEGRTFFDIPEDGKYKITFVHPEYITSRFEIEIMANTLFFNRFSISPRMPVGTLRVVLDWSDKPSDLDSHIEKQNGYHISYRNTMATSDGIAKLDHDAMQGYGPETITVKIVDANAVYEYYVYDFSNQRNKHSTLLSNSKASVKVYGGNNELLEVFKIPENIGGDTWRVFKLINGRIEIINSVE